MTRMVVPMVSVVLLAPALAGAQPPLRLSLEDAVSRALASAPRVAEAHAREAVADAAIAARAALARPIVTASSGYLRTNHVEEFGVPQPNGTTRVIFPDIPSNYRTRAEISVPVYTGGRISGLVASAEAGRRAAGAETRTVEADVTLNVVSTYWTLVVSRERVHVLERALARADTQLETVRARVDAGVLPPNDVLSAQAQRARQRVALIQAQNDAALAEADLARLIGAAPGESIVATSSVAEPATAALSLATQAVDGLVAQALEARTERRALVDRQAALRLTADVAAAATRPQIGLLAAVEPARPNPRFVPRVDRWNTGWDLGLTLTWSVWDGGRTRADRASATAEADALQHRIDEFDALVGLEVRQRRLELESGRAALLASEEAVAAAAEARRVVGERFTAGVATNTDVLEADLALLDAELERTRLQSGLRIAEARLVRAVGRP